MEAYGDCLKKEEQFRRCGVRHKEKNNMTFFLPMIPLNVITRSLVSYLKANTLIDTPVQKAGISEWKTGGGQFSLY